MLSLLPQGDAGLAKLAYEVLHDVIKRTTRTNYYLFHTDTCIWEQCGEDRLRMVISDELSTVLDDMVLHYMIKVETEKNELHIHKWEERKVMASKAFDFVKSSPGIHRVLSIASPLFMDKNFEQQLDHHRHLLGVRNGVVDLRTGEVRKRKPEDFIYTIVDVEYNKNADTLLIESTVRTIMAEDEGMVRFMQRLLGYAITGEVSEEIFAVFTGDGGNGKGIISQLLEKMFGRFFVTMDASLITKRKVPNEPAELGKLLNSRIAYFKELQPDEKLRTSQVQLLSGGDPIAATPKYKDPMTILPYHTCILETNHMPVLSVVKPAIMRRVVCVHFPVTFTDLEPDEEPTLFRKQVDRTLKERVSADYGGALAWIVKGAVDWYASPGLKQSAPSKVTDFSNEYFQQQDKLALFLSQMCSTGAGVGHTSSTIFLDTYNRWAGREEYPRLTPNKLVEAMKAKGFEKKQIYPTPGAARIHCFLNVKISEEDDTSSPKELQFKAALEAHTGLKFEKQRPAWLLNPRTGHRMELDMVNEELRIAVEYDGRHHREYPNAFQATKREHEQQIYRDSLKADLCLKHGYKLIRVIACADVSDELSAYMAALQSL